MKTKMFFIKTSLCYTTMRKNKQKRRNQNFSQSVVLQKNQERKYFWTFLFFLIPIRFCILLCWFFKRLQTFKKSELTTLYYRENTLSYLIPLSDQNKTDKTTHITNNISCIIFLSLLLTSKVQGVKIISFSE